MTDPPRRRQGGGALWDRVQHIFGQLCGPDHNRTVDALSSRFRVLRLECERFDGYFKKAEREMPDLVEDDQKEVALINYRMTRDMNSSMSRSGRLLGYGFRIFFIMFCLLLTCYV
ncbi:hypothetical protein Hanom_Chr15g01395871 [Helianthus anomalus]